MDGFFDDYYNSLVFNQVSHQLSSINGTINDQQLGQYFKFLISFHLREQYKRSENEFQSKMEIFKAQRQKLINDEIINLDNELSQIFNNLDQYPTNINDLRQIQFLVLKRGACLECSDSQNGPSNLAMAINRLLHSDLNNINSGNKLFFRLKTEMFKTLIISNSRLLNNRDYYIYTDDTV
ncbi:unnamed protein product [Didymodactylos carnosus]|uniref:Uncharacterized protein n=1 Tax=Didymodactylos carnosus TaxID=1234261 RepID=A0A814A7V6_9BILA|nr:unnamed protein product [Didymodactylos carnosus]CAF0908871.1 unnamed protein product [Didymodactylos carnosus]CAF3686240.1 unnamed protein product [Didymodactylos carnosus]CAF3690301.1 unnamed protein product [Didymodactylos carnosus]